MALLEELTSLYPASAFIRSDTVRISWPRPYGTHVRPAPPPARLTSRQNHLGERIRGIVQWPLHSPRGTDHGARPLVLGAQLTHAAVGTQRRMPWRQLNRVSQHDYDHQHSKELDRLRGSRHHGLPDPAQSPHSHHALHFEIKRQCRETRPNPLSEVGLRHGPTNLDRRSKLLLLYMLIYRY